MRGANTCSTFATPLTPRQGSPASSNATPSRRSHHDHLRHLDERGAGHADALDAIGTFVDRRPDRLPWRPRPLRGHSIDL